MPQKISVFFQQSLQFLYPESHKENITTLYQPAKDHCSKRIPCPEKENYHQIDRVFLSLPHFHPQSFHTSANNGVEDVDKHPYSVEIWTLTLRTEKNDDTASILSSP